MRGGKNYTFFKYSENVFLLKIKGALCSLGKAF